MNRILVISAILILFIEFQLGVGVLMADAMSSDSGHMSEVFIWAAFLIYVVISFGLPLTSAIFGIKSTNQNYKIHALGIILLSPVIALLINLFVLWMGQN